MDMCITYLSLLLVSPYCNQQWASYETQYLYQSRHEEMRMHADFKMGWTMGLEPTTAGITTRSSTS